MKNSPEYKKKHQERSYAKLIAYLLEHPCVDCGEADPLVLDFDHVRGKKTLDVNRMINYRYGWNRILEEIEKCEVRCCLCHRRQTAIRGNFQRWRHCKEIYATVQAMEKLRRKKSA